MSLCKYNNSQNIDLGLVCSHGHFDIAKWLLSNRLVSNDDMLNYACIYDNLEIVKLCLNSKPSKKLFEITCENDCVNVAKYLYTLEVFDLDYYLLVACNYNSYEIIEWIVSTMNFKILKYQSLLKLTCKTNNSELANWLIMKGAESKDELFRLACENGSLEVAQLLHGCEIDINSRDDRYYELKLDYEYLYNKDVYIDYPDIQYKMKQIHNSLELACINNHVEIVKWINSIQKITNPTEYFELACYYGNLSVAKWLWDNFKIKYKSTCFGKDYTNNICEKGYLDIAKWLHFIIPGIFKDTYYPGSYIEYGNIEFMKWYVIDIHRHFVSFSYWNCKNNFEMIKWIYDLDCIYFFRCTKDWTNKDKQCKHKDNENIMYSACKYGNLKMAQWIYSKGVDIHGCYLYHYYYFNVACENGHLDIAKWLFSLNVNIHEQDDRAFVYASMNDHLDVVKWLYSIDPSLINKFKLINKYNNYNVLKWLYSINPDYITKYVNYIIDKHCNINILRWLLIDLKLEINQKKLTDIFKYRCIQGDLNTAKLLFSLWSEIPNDVIVCFKHIINNGNLQFVKWFYSIGFDIYNNISVSKTFEYLYELYFDRDCYYYENDVHDYGDVDGYSHYSGYHTEYRFKIDEYYRRHKYLELAKFLYTISDKTKQYNSNKYYEIKEFIQNEKSIYIMEFVEKLKFHEIYKIPMFDMNVFMIEIWNYLFFNKTSIF